MNSIDANEPDRQQPRAPSAVRWGLVLAVVLAILAFSTWLAYPRIAAKRLQTQLQTANSVTELKPIINSLISARTQPARKVLMEYAEESALRQYDPFHNTLLFADVSDNGIHIATPWGWSTLTPKDPTDYAELVIVENVSKCVAFAVTKENTDSVTLYLQSYRHSASRDVTSAELADWKKAGIWDKYVAEYGDPLITQKETWDDQNEREYKEWTSGP